MHRCTLPQWCVWCVATCAASAGTVERVASHCRCVCTRLLAVPKVASTALSPAFKSLVSIKMKRKQTSLMDLWGLQSGRQTSIPPARRQIPASIEVVATSQTQSLPGTLHPDRSQNSTLESSDDSLIAQTSTAPFKSDVATARAPPSSRPSNATSGPTKPFEPREVYVCPYVNASTCSHRDGCFQSFRGLVQHIDLGHRKDRIVSYHTSKLEDGTRKIPCPNGCSHLSVTHQKANHHARNKECSAPKLITLQCPWGPYNACNITAKNANGLAGHLRVHKSDSRAPYLCSHDGCGVHHVNLYTLAMHEESCKHREATARQTCYRTALDVAAMAGAPPALIIVNRSSSHPPKSWNAGRKDLRDGLLLVGTSLLEDYTAMHGTGIVSAVLHSCSNCSTRQLPAMTVDKSIFGSNLHARLAHHRAFCFTNAIVEDIVAANAAGITPTLLSVGLDGWACDERRLLPWLQASNLTFDLVVRMNGLNFGMSDTYVQQYGSVYWSSYNLGEIKDALESGPGSDAKTDELIACWKTCQSGKDTSFGVNVGRNTVNITYSAV